LKSAFRVSAVALAAFLAAGGLASAGGEEDSKQLAVVSATPDLVNENLTLQGVNFGVTSGVVTLDGLPLALISWADTQIVVALSPNVLAVPGSYLATVTRSRDRRSGDDGDDDGSKKRSGSFIVTLGAVGPQGEKGDPGGKGEKGETGDAGAQGVKGDKGDTGAQGIQGTKGDKGDKGDTGTTGAQGPKGENGSNGAQGVQGPQGDKGDPGVVPGASMVGPAIFAATNTACGYVPGQLTTNDSCSVNACQDRPTDDRSTAAAPCQGETSTSFVSSTPVSHSPGCSPGYIESGGQCCLCILSCSCSPKPPTTTTFNVCFSCLSSFPELGKLVK